MRPLFRWLRDRRTTRYDHLFGAVMGALFVGVLLHSSLDLAMSRDESFYVYAAERYGTWIEQAATDWSAASERSVIDRHWEYNHEHPALMKSLFALSHLAHQKWSLFPTDGASFRFPGMLTAGLMLWLLHIFGTQLFGRGVGLSAMVFYALLPRVFYHSQLDCFDIPIAFFLTLVTYCYWRSFQDRRYLLWLGVSYGLALATKHNSWILPGVFLIHFGFVAWAEVQRRKRGEAKQVRLVPYWLLSMATIGPVLFVLSWPWLWNDGWARFVWYANFHLRHVHYDYAYLGETYFQPPFPIAVPFVMTLFTVTMSTLAMSLFGLGTRLRALLPDGLQARLWPEGRVEADARASDVLLVGAMLAPLVVIALPSSPIFGGTKHWFPAYPFLAIYAGVGLVQTLRLLVPLVQRAYGRALVTRGSAAAICCLVWAPGLVETVHSHPFGLSHYTFAAGGVPGSADLGMNRQFWGFTQGSLSGWFKQHLPNGGSVWPCDATQIAWRQMQRDGMIPDNIRVASSIGTADLALVHHELHFAEIDFQIWRAYGTTQPAEVLAYDGVPIVTVYANPKSRRFLAQPDAAQPDRADSGAMKAE